MKSIKKISKFEYDNLTSVETKITWKRESEVNVKTGRMAWLKANDVNSAITAAVSCKKLA